MPRRSRKYHFIYRTTNLLNEKFYVGMHSTDNLEDGYVGSGKRLGYSIRKYGLENHKFEILEFLPSREELKKREAEVVNEEMLKHPLCMNLKFGGEGGWDYLNKSKKNLYGNNGKDGFGKQNLLLGASLHDHLMSSGKSDEYRSKMSETMKAKRLENPELWKTSTLSDAHKAKIGKANSERQSGKGNSQFGTCWICDGSEAKKIKKDELQLWLNNGWVQGRKLNSPAA